MINLLTLSSFSRGLNASLRLAENIKASNNKEQIKTSRRECSQQNVILHDVGNLIVELINIYALLTIQEQLTRYCEVL